MKTQLLHSRTALAAALVILVVAEFGSLHWLAPLEHRVQDALVRMDAATRAPDPDIVMVQIDERSLAEMAKPEDQGGPGAGRYPWPRSFQADLLAGILAEQPRAVVYDILFSDPTNADEDAYFVKTALSTDLTYFPLVLLDVADGSGLDLARFGEPLGFEKTGAAPGKVAMAIALPPLPAAGRNGSINFLDDGDGIGRRYTLRTEAGGFRIPSLPARVAKGLGYAIPDADSVILHWRGTPESRPYISFVDLYRDFTSGKHSRRADELKDKIVVIGTNASSMGDLRPTPILGQHPGPDIVAAAIETLKNGDALRRTPEWFDGLVALVLVAGVLLSMQGRGGLIGVGICLLLLTPLEVFGAGKLVAHNLLVPAFAPLAFAWLAYFAVALQSYLRERKARMEAVQTFGRFVDPNVVESLVREGSDELTHEPRSLPISVLFSDIRGYTSLSEKRTPKEIMELLNKYFSRQVDVVFRNGGTVNKFIGDCIMAVWNAPVETPDHAQRAVRAALEMSVVMDQFRAEVAGSGDEFDIGIGVHTGDAVVGFLGSKDRLEYTAIGDTVNLASRIEGETKNQKCRILVSEATMAACKDSFDFAPRNPFNAKGRTEATPLFEPLRGK